MNSTVIIGKGRVGSLTRVGSRKQEQLLFCALGDRMLCEEPQG